MAEKINLEEHIAKGVEKIVSETLKATLKDPRESAFMVKFATASRKATKTRLQLAEEGEHIPSFLIASITSRCNLHCAGCYSRCNEATVDAEPVQQLTGEEWVKVFREAEELGVSFIMLAGGEPMLRWDVIEGAGAMQNIIFPVFTNGTYMNERYLKLFDKCRNLIPVMSIEGGKEITDERRGTGVYDKLIANMDTFREKNLLFGASVTVTTENIKEVTSPEFLKVLMDRGCKLVIYVEFVPVTEEAKHLAPGGAEPCPFSPYSDVNVREQGLREAMHSRLFRELRDGDFLDDDHVGGCVLFEKREQVEAMLAAPVSVQA